MPSAITWFAPQSENQRRPSCQRGDSPNTMPSIRTSAAPTLTSPSRRSPGNADRQAPELIAPAARSTTATSESAPAPPPRPAPAGHLARLEARQLYRPLVAIDVLAALSPNPARRGPPYPHGAPQRCRAYRTSGSGTPLRRSRAPSAACRTAVRDRCPGHGQLRAWPAALADGRGWPVRSGQAGHCISGQLFTGRHQRHKPRRYRWRKARAAWRVRRGGPPGGWACRGPRATRRGGSLARLILLRLEQRRPGCLPSP